MIDKAMQYLLGSILLVLSCLVYTPIANSASSTIPVNAVQQLPILVEVVEDKWADFPLPASFAALIEKESCITLRHSKCWTPYAELKTKREYGFGLGQITIAYDAKGKVRFNNFDESKRFDPELRNWKYSDRYNPRYQMIALVKHNYFNWQRLGRMNISSDWEQAAMMFSAYNGGLGGLLKDIRLCAATAGCDSSKWFDNVENTSSKAKVAASGYGKSFFQINREYVKEVLIIRRPKYEPYFETGKVEP